MKILFNVISIFSIASFALAGLLLYIHFTVESPGMIMIYLMPLLFIGLLLGIVAFIINKTKKLVLTNFSSWIYKLNLSLMLFGVIALIYIFLNE